MVMSCILGRCRMAFNLRLKEELARLGWLERQTRLTILPELNDEEPPPTVPPRRPADFLCPSLSRASDRQCCGWS